jgi:hypothetical protein
MSLAVKWNFSLVMVRFSDSLGNITVFHFYFQARQDQIPFSARSILKKYRENARMIAAKSQASLAA